MEYALPDSLLLLAKTQFSVVPQKFSTQGSVRILGLLSSHSADAATHQSVALCGPYVAPGRANAAAALALQPLCCCSQVRVQSCIDFGAHHLFGAGVGAFLRHRLCAK